MPPPTVELPPELHVGEPLGKLLPRVNQILRTNEARLEPAVMRLLVGPGGGTAVYTERHARDVAGPVTEEPCSSFRDLIGLSDSAEGGEGAEVVDDAWDSLLPSHHQIGRAHV